MLLAWPPRAERFGHPARQVASRQPARGGRPHDHERAIRKMKDTHAQQRRPRDLLRGRRAVSTMSLAPTVRGVTIQDLGTGHQTRRETTIFALLYQCRTRAGEQQATSSVVLGRR